MTAPRISAVDLFSGAGGLSLGLKQSGISIAGGIDVDGMCKYAYEHNIEAPFLERVCQELCVTDLA